LKRLDYDDSRSLKLKYDIAERAGVRGVGVWTANSLDYSSASATQFWRDLGSYKGGFVKPRKTDDGQASSWTRRRHDSRTAGLPGKLKYLSVYALVLWDDDAPAQLRAVDVNLATPAMTKLSAVPPIKIDDRFIAADSSVDWPQFLARHGLMWAWSRIPRPHPQAFVAQTHSVLSRALAGPDRASTPLCRTTARTWPSSS
jgi:hypothetical protein